jgi:hypothetical protein
LALLAMPELIAARLTPLSNILESNLMVVGITA